MILFVHCYILKAGCQGKTEGFVLHLVLHLKIFLKTLANDMIIDKFIREKQTLQTNVYGDDNNNDKL